MPTCQKCEENFPNHVLIENKRRNLCNRKYCLNCSPFCSHNTKQIHKVETIENKTCPHCKQDKTLDEFYLRKRGKKKSLEPSPYCKSCTNKMTADKGRNIKKKAVELKGGKCENCGYDRYIGALEFHHLDPTKKELTISKTRISFENLLKELEKCLLLCSNCHREEHARINGLL
jgi:glutaredoxin